MTIDSLLEMAGRYEAATKQHRTLETYAQANREVDVCGHLHTQVSQLFNVVRRRKPEHKGMSIEESILDELADILCLWCCAIRVLAPGASVQEIIERAGRVFVDQAREKSGKEISPAD